jgi:predicted methyltransferase
VSFPVQPECPTIELVTEPEGETTLYIDHRQAMQAWERDLMHRSADLLCQHGSTFLEVVLGLGLSALHIANHPNTRHHTVIEKYQQVIDLFGVSHPEIPRTLEIVHADFLDHMHALEPSSLDGIFFDPFLPAEIRNDQRFWDVVMPVLTRSLRRDGVFIPCFSTHPILYWIDYFERVSVERHDFVAYATTEYTHVTSGHAYIHGYSRPTPVAPR